MIVNFNQKETSLLKDLKSHEELCIKKYTSYANIASDPELKSLFQSHASNESSHLNSINQLLSGQLPNMNSQSGGGQSQASQGSSMGSTQGQAKQSSSMGSTQGQTEQGSSMGWSQGQDNQPQFSDKDLCTDILSTEKYISSTYNTAIFEFTDPQVRDVLNHIQKEEQQHGESVFKYMESKGLYQPQ